MALSNPNLTTLITEKIGDDWIKDLDQLKKLEAFADDKRFQDDWRRVKLGNKERLAAEIRRKTGIDLNCDSLFDVQVKRIHEYKRQHLNVLHIIALYARMKFDHADVAVSRVFIFGGKAAPGYFIAKLMIKLISSVADVVKQ